MGERGGRNFSGGEFRTKFKLFQVRLVVAAHANGNFI